MHTPTDWNLLRQMMAAAIDSCEAIEALGLEEGDRGRPVGLAAAGGTVWDSLTSAWTYPENMRYQIVQARHAAGTSLPYVPPAARTLVHMAQACAELIGAAGPDAPAPQQLQAMLGWYRDHLVPGLRAAARDAEADGSAAVTS